MADSAAAPIPQTLQVRAGNRVYKKRLTALDSVPSKPRGDQRFDIGAPLQLSVQAFPSTTHAGAHIVSTAHVLCPTHTRWPRDKQPHATAHSPLNRRLLQSAVAIEKGFFPKASGATLCREDTRSKSSSPFASMSWWCSDETRRVTRIFFEYLRKPMGAVNRNNSLNSPARLACDLLR
ncbi:hypothetical protein MRX96_036785 [Rhipicephalus microplus]